MSGGELRRAFEELLDASPQEREGLLAGRSEDERTRLNAMLDAEASFDDGAEDDGAARPYPWPGDAVGAYRLLAPIGDGGMGSVWLAEARGAPEVRVAIKFAAATRVDAEEARARLEQERRILARLDHPAIVDVVDAGDSGPQGPYLVMPLVDGAPLDAHAREVARGSRAAVAAVMRRLSEAVEHVHARGFVHRDIKPSNVLVRDDGTPMLLDFGVARALEEGALTEAYVTQGVAPHTPAFASPEQERGEEITPRADVFALGRVLRACADAAGLSGDADLDAIVARACADDASRRYATAAAFGAAVDAWGAGRIDRRGTPWAVVAGTAMLAAVAGWWIGGTGTASPDEGPEAVLLAGLADTPVTELTGDVDAFAALAERAPLDGWAVAAAWAALDEDDAEAARDFAADALEIAADLSPVRQLDLALVGDRLGLPGPTIAALEAALDEELEPEAELSARAMLLAQRVRAGEEPDLMDFEELEALRHEVAERHDLELDEVELEELDVHDTGAQLLLAGLAAGAPGPVTHWCEGVELAAYREPVDAPASLIAALLTLHARLAAEGGARPLDAEQLEEIEEDLWERFDGEHEQGALRGWCIARGLRTLRAAEDDAGAAADLARDAVERLTEAGGVPADQLAVLGVLLARTQLDDGDREGASETATEALELAEACGPMLVERLAEWDVDELGPWILVGETSAERASEVREALDEQREARRDKPWWAR